MSSVKYGFGVKLLEAVNERLADQGARFRKGTVADAGRIAAPSRRRPRAGEVTMPYGQQYAESSHGVVWPSRSPWSTLTTTPSAP